MMLGLALAWIAICVGSWLGWQLLRQNGRILLRLDELETRLDKLEFGEDEQLMGLPVGSEAPSFELPDLAGEARSLAHYRGQSLLLLFFNPACGFCRELVPRLAASRKPEFSGEKPDSEGGTRPLVLIISTGGPEANRQIFDEYKLDCPVLLQKQSEVATTYQANGTPSGYLIDADGKIASEFAIGADALLALLSDQSKIKNQKSKIATNGDQHANRFNNRSLARSKIKRDGLKAGTPAPDFRLPRLDGRGDLSLSELRGQRVLLVFSSPNCGPCNTLAPELEKFSRSQNGAMSGRTVGEGSITLEVLSPRGPRSAERSADLGQPSGGGLGKPLGQGEGEPSLPLQVVMISKGEPKENRAKIKEHGLTFPIVLQQQWEISRRYAMFATPIAYLIDEHGIITHDVAVGTDAIQRLLQECSPSSERLLITDH
jgi:peroxiredoxin